MYPKEFSSGLSLKCIQQILRQFLKKARRDLKYVFGKSDRAGLLFCPSLSLWMTMLYKFSVILCIQDYNAPIFPPFYREYLMISDDPVKNDSEVGPKLLGCDEFYI